MFVQLPRIEFFHIIENMKAYLKPFVFVLFMLVAGKNYAQEVSRMTITDHFAGSTKVTMGKPKPAPAKDKFVLVSDDKGTQVMIYLDMIPNPQLPNPYILKFTAYKIVNGKNEVVDDRDLPVKNTAGYALSAFNFFEEGNYKIVVTDQSGKNILSEGSFIVSR
jgi:hypothetical protein